MHTGAQKYNLCKVHTTKISKIKKKVCHGYVSLLSPYIQLQEQAIRTVAIQQRKAKVTAEKDICVYKYIQPAFSLPTD